MDSGSHQVSSLTLCSMKTRTKWIATAGLALVIAAGASTAVAATSGDDGSGTPITGNALDRASAVALDAVGSGTVTATEIGDEDSYYEIEVTKPDGSQVDVQLDRDFTLVSETADSEHGD